MASNEQFNSTRSAGQSSLIGIHHITAMASDPQRNVDFFVRVLGLRLVKRTVNFDAPDVYHFYYGDETGTPGTILTFFPFQDAGRGKRGAGEVGSVAFHVPPGARDYWIHHIAWRVSGYDHQADWRARVAEAGHSVTDIVDRQYFKSIYFHEPGGVLFEIATDEPGFTVDESKEALGSTLKLPPWIEPHRRQLERVLPPIDNSTSRHSQQQTLVS